MPRHYDPSHQLRRREFDSKTNEYLHDEVSSCNADITLKSKTDIFKNIFAFIVEVEQAADCLMPRELPVIALCDAGSRTNWVSSKFLEDLERSVSTTLKLSSRSGHRKGSEARRINIRWTCGKLGQYSAEGTFFIEPKAHFKILFGCRYEIKPNLVPADRNSRLSSRYTSKRDQKNRKEQPLSAEVADSFRQGIEDGTLIRLKRMPHLSHHGLSVSLAELEVELQYSYDIHSLTERALSSDSIADDSSSYIPSSAAHALSSIEISSIRGSETDVDDYGYTESANTSLWDDPPRGHSLSERLRAERGSPPPYSLQGWYVQDVCEEPQPFLSRMIQPRRIPFYFKRCVTLNSKQQQDLAALKAAAEKAASDYWQWDEEAKNYKHYDEGSSVPVWYNPP
jgi:hypothetical protein